MDRVGFLGHWSWDYTELDALYLIHFPAELERFYYLDKCQEHIMVGVAVTRNMPLGKMYYASN